MTCLLDVCKAPIPYEPDRGAETRAEFPEFPDNLLDLIEGTAGCSPYLRGSILREA
ncbi:MAG: hypothetical protein JKY31_12635, partial [Rhodobacteraceae bacterium]|nr:hypothetical protein [Paracoccaceae bacterium]